MTADPIWETDQRHKHCLETIERLSDERDGLLAALRLAVEELEFDQQYWVVCASGEPRLVTDALTAARTAIARVTGGASDTGIDSTDETTLARG